MFQNVAPAIYKGRIIQLLRCFNHEQDEYYGKVQGQLDLIYGFLHLSSKNIVSTADTQNNDEVYQYGINGLTDKKTYLQIGDSVTFQIGVHADGSMKACNITKKEKEIKRAKVDSIKGQVSISRNVRTKINVCLTVSCCSMVLLIMRLTIRRSCFST
jgi:hypothetical protein